MESVGLTVGLASWRDAVSGSGVRSFIPTALNWAWEGINMMTHVQMMFLTVQTAGTPIVDTYRN